MTSLADPPTRSLAERTVDAVTARLARRHVSRRRFLARSTVVASALAVDPVRYVLRPGTAYATVCGEAASCGGKRRVCCNVFRYGQCHHEVPGVTEVVCRVVTCTVPWEWDEECSDTVRSDNRTATHTATCLPGRNPSWIEIKYMDIGLAGSIAGRPTRGERDVAGGGRRADYDHGLIVWSETTEAHALDGAIADRYETRVLPADVELPEDGSWPEMVQVERWSGADRIATGAAVAEQSWPDGADLAFVASARDFADALSGGVAATVHEGPLLLTEPDEVPPALADVLDRLGVGRVVVLGGPTAVSEDVAAVLRDRVGSVHRWDGADRHATAARISRHLFRPLFPDGAEVVHVATGREFPDALAAVPAAVAAGGPVLLVDTEAVPDVVVEELRRLRPRRAVVLVGGTKVLSRSVQRHLAAAPAPPEPEPEPDPEPGPTSPGPSPTSTGVSA